MSYRRAKSLDKSLLYAEYFNSEQEALRQADISNLPISNGVAEFDGSQGDYHFNFRTNGTYTVRIRLSEFDSANGIQYFFDARDGGNGTGSIYYSAGQVSGASKKYYDGVEQIGAIVPSTSVREFTFVTSLLSGNYLYFGKAQPISYYRLVANVELFEIYEGELTAEEVSNLYNDARYVLPNLEKKEQLGSILNVSNCENSGVQPYDTFTNATSTGFDAINAAGAVAYGGTAAEIATEIGDKFIVEFDYVTSGDDDPFMRLSTSGGSGRSNILYPSAGHNEMVFIATHVGSAMMLQFYSSAVQDVNFSVSNLSIRKEVIPETKTILNVNAFSGVARNVLSGDIVNIMDEGKGSFDSGTENWLLFGTNTIENDNGALKITYVDHISGAYTQFRESTSVKKDLVVGNTYNIHVKAKVNSGSSVNLLHVANFATVSSTSYQWYSGTFIATNAITNNLRMGSMASGEIIWIDQWYLEEVIPEVTNTDLEIVKA